MPRPKSRSLSSTGSVDVEPSAGPADAPQGSGAGVSPSSSSASSPSSFGAGGRAAFAFLSLPPLIHESIKSASAASTRPAGGIGEPELCIRTEIAERPAAAASKTTKSCLILGAMAKSSATPRQNLRIVDYERETCVYVSPPVRGLELFRHPLAGLDGSLGAAVLGRIAADVDAALWLPELVGQVVEARVFWALSSGVNGSRR